MIVCPSATPKRCKVWGKYTNATFSIFDSTTPLSKSAVGSTHAASILQAYVRGMRFILGMPYNFEETEQLCLDGKRFQPVETGWRNVAIQMQLRVSMNLSSKENLNNSHSPRSRPLRHIQTHVETHIIIIGTVYAGNILAEKILGAGYTDFGSIVQQWKLKKIGDARI